MVIRASVAVVLFLSVIPPANAQSPVDVARSTPYSGRPLDGSIFLCSSDSVAAGGFRKEVETGRVLQIAELSREKNSTTWRITLRRDQAEVAAFTGATQTLDAPEVFGVSRTADALSMFRREGLNSQTITIDLGNSSFVYSGHSVNALMNKTNVFVGACRPYV